MAVWCWMCSIGRRRVRGGISGEGGALIVEEGELVANLCLDGMFVLLTWQELRIKESSHVHQRKGNLIEFLVIRLSLIKVCSLVV